MSLVSGTTTVGLTSTLIDGVAWHNPVLVQIHNNDNTADVFIGGSNVSTTNGLKLLKAESMTITLLPANQLWAISTKEGHVISWIRQPL